MRRRDWFDFDAVSLCTLSKTLFKWFEFEYIENLQDNRFFPMIYNTTGIAIWSIVVKVVCLRLDTSEFRFHNFESTQKWYG
jgi:hypothetical protein